MREEARAKEKERESPERKDLTTSRQFLFTARLQYRGECGSCVCVCATMTKERRQWRRTHAEDDGRRAAPLSLFVFSYSTGERESGIER